MYDFYIADHMLLSDVMKDKIKRVHIVDKKNTIAFRLVPRETNYR